MKISIGILIIFLASVGTALSEPPSPGPEPQQQKFKPEKFLVKRDNDRPGTINAPTTEADKKSAQSGDKQKQSTSSEWVLVYLTGALVFVGALQTVVFGRQARRLGQTIIAMREIAETQSRDMQKSIAATEEAAKAALKSADTAEKALSVLEKPFLFIDPNISFTRDLKQLAALANQQRPAGEILGQPIEINYFFRNLGRTPAIIRQFYIDLNAWDSMPENRIVRGVPTLPPTIAIEGNAAGDRLTAKIDHVIGPVFDKILTSTSFLFFYGEIIYQDVFAFKHALGFGMMYDNSDNRWKPQGGEEYNFHITITPHPDNKVPRRL